MATFFIDPVNGNDVNAGTSFSLRKKTLSGVNPSAGDTIRIIRNVTSSLGISVTFTNLSLNLTLASVLNATIDNCDTAWTPSTNVTQAQDTTTKKEGTASQKLTIAAGFTTGLVAFRAMTSTDFSGYQQVSFWFKFSAGTIAAGNFELRLCSDVAGVTAVNTLALPAIAGTGQWIALTLDNASALGSAIQSVALYRNSNLGAQDVFLDNVISVKAASAPDSLSLTSLIGKNDGNGWFTIKSISGTTVVIDSEVASSAGAGRGYFGVSETVTGYKFEPFKHTSMMSSATTVLFSFSQTGTTSGAITISGGWNETDMSTQGASDFSWYTGQNGFGNVISLSNTSALNWVFDRLGFSRCNVGLTNSATGSASFQITNCELTSISSNPFSYFGSAHNFKNIHYHNGLGVPVINGPQWILDNMRGHSNGTAGGALFLNNSSAYLTLIKNSSFCNNIGYAISATQSATVRNCTFSNNVTGTINFSCEYIYAYDCTFSDSTLATFSSTNGNMAVFSQNHNGTGETQILMSGATLGSTTSVRHTASGRSWFLSPTNASRWSGNPVPLKVASIPCAANKTVTAKIWAQRSNTGLTLQLVCPGGQIAGVTNDVSATASAAANAWEQLTISFTPTVTGIIDLYCYAYGGTTFTGYVDDLSFSST